MKFSPNQKADAIKYVICQFDKNNSIEVKKIAKKRTLSQNRYLHLLLNYFAIEYGYSLEYVKQEIFKRIVNENIFKKLDHSKYGLVYIYYRSTSELDTNEMTIAIERFKNYSAENGLALPDADNFEFLQHIENEIEKYQQYL